MRAVACAERFGRAFWSCRQFLMRFVSLIVQKARGACWGVELILQDSLMLL